MSMTTAGSSNNPAQSSHLREYAIQVLEKDRLIERALPTLVRDLVNRRHLPPRSTQPIHLPGVPSW